MDRRLFIDQLKDSIEVRFPPRRIVSLVPSQTELLFDLGLENEVVGITKFCVHPSQWNQEKKIIGGTKNFNIALIDSLAPDLIIGNKEENDEQGIHELKMRYPVWMSDIYDLAGAAAMIRSIGELTDTSPLANQINDQINLSFQSIQKSPHKKRVLYMIWRNPWMAAGGKTFINSMLQSIGFENCLSSESRYPELTTKEILQLSPELIFLSTEPFPFKQTHIEELQNLAPNTKVMLVDGEMFSWYGSRLIQAPKYFDRLLNEVHG
jgi:ABC-type Fe3+-hydroxamate transport system substrate-binding protein